jgi:DNA-binding transcriptional LysR family regulator
MRPPELGGVDLNLLVVLRALLAERHVTRAARSVGLSQSAASHALARLRDLYRDPLLVRAGRTLEPTPRALALLPAIDRALAEIQATIVGPAPFDPRTEHRTFTFGMADYGQAMLCGPMLARLAREAPGIDVAVSSGEGVDDLVDEGVLDLGVTVRPPRSGGPSSTELFSDDFVCIVRKGHPEATERITLKRYLALRHVVVAPSGSPGSVVDTELARRGLRRRVAARVPSFLVAPIVVSGSDFINTGPARLARLLAERHPIALVRPPLRLPSFTLYLVWPRRFDQDPAHRWFRELVIGTAKAIAG